MIEKCNFKGKDVNEILCKLTGRYVSYTYCVGENNCIVYQTYINTLNIKTLNEAKNIKNEENHKINEDRLNDKNM